jgi:two-component system chemotaxis response regulator CheB
MNTEAGASIAAIVIGASAGGIEVLMKILPALPRHAKVPVFITLHVSAGHNGLLAKIFQSKCALPVFEAEDKQAVEPGTIYFAPPDYHLLVDEGAVAGESPHLSLSIDGPVNYSRPSIDVLFESAADVYGAQLLGVLLSGGNDDGVAGLQRIQKLGGVTMVQNPSDAMAPFMPAAALARLPIDYTLTRQQIASEFAAIGNTQRLSHRPASPSPLTGSPSPSTGKQP